MSTPSRFESLRSALMREGTPGRTPLVEFDVDTGVMAAFLRRPVEGPRDVVDFWAEAGYGHVPVSVGLLELGGVLSGEASMVKQDRYSLYSDEPVEMKWAAEHRGVITSFDELDAHRWPNPEDVDLSRLSEIAALLPPDMRVTACLGKVFTSAWMLMGFETFCMALMEEPDLVQAMVERTAALQCAALERALGQVGVAAVLIADDIAYGTSTMVHPDVLRDLVFPWFRRMVDMCHDRGVPAVYHSDGCLYPVVEDLIACGFDALHPVEPQAMDPARLKGMVEGRLCLLGGVDVDLLARGAPAAVQDAARRNIEVMGYDGAYALGSANSIPGYVPVDNYRAMIAVADESV